MEPHALFLLPLLLLLLLPLLPLQSSQARQTSVAFQSLNGLKQGATFFYISFPALLEPFVVQIIVVNFNSLVHFNFPENLNFSKFKSSH